MSENEMNLKKISNSFEETIKDSNLTDVNIELSEVVIDSFLNDGTLKDIPILGIFCSLSKFTLNMTDRLFIKKIIYFISELKEIPQSKRSEMISKIENSDKYQTKVGDKLLYIIDKCEDHIMTEYIAKFFKAFLNEKITYSEFLRCSNILQNIFLEDFEYFLDNLNLNTKKINNNYISELERSLLSSGLCYEEIGEMHYTNKSDYINRTIISIDGGNKKLYLTQIGRKIKEALN